MSRLTNKSGVALLISLAVMAVVIMLAKSFLDLVNNQNKLTRHKVSRVQAYYAGRLGMQYAIEMLRKNDPDWPATGSYNHTICRRAEDGCTKTETALPPGINNIFIKVNAPGTGVAGTRKIDISVNYTAPF